MDFSLTTDDLGRFVGILTDGHSEGMVTASNVPEAGFDLLAALRSVQAEGYAECVWQEQGGEYRWMLRRDDDRVQIAVLWSTGTITGWEHVFRADCGVREFASRVTRELGKHGIT